MTICGTWTLWNTKKTNQKRWNSLSTRNRFQMLPQPREVFFLIDCITAKFTIEGVTGCGAYGSVNQSVARHPFIALYYFKGPSSLKRGEFVLEI